MARTRSRPINILYSFRRCPYAIRTRLAIAYADRPEKPLKLELREIVLKNKPTEMLAASPKGTVPVLVLADGQVIEESREIMGWALAHNDPDSLQTAEAIVWLDECDGEFKHWLDRYKYADRFPEHTENHYRQQGEQFLAKLEGVLAQHEFILGATMSIADIGLFPFVRQFAFVNKAGFDACTAYPHLQRWLQYWLESALFESVMHKHKPWQVGDEVLEFPL